VRLKRELWARLLTTAFGTGFEDSDELFVEHTLLVVTAEVIAHGVIGLDPTAQDVAPLAIVTGQLFASAQVYGVVEADFFDWVAEVDGGQPFIRLLARRLSRFAWHNVEHDVLKIFYESIISTAQRKQLGEYYTPDWLADRIVHATVGHLWSAALVCPCGCGQLLQLNLVRTSRPYWRLQQDRFGRASLHPSVWRRTTCRSHFWVRRGKIVSVGSGEGSND
jgi:hypothetical protein